MSAAACAIVAARHARKLESFSCPGAKALVERARRAAADAPPESRDAFARLELDLIFHEARGTLALGTLLPRGMARVSFAMGTGFAVLCFARATKDGLGPAGLGAFAAFAGGIVGSLLASRFGQRAKQCVEAEREAWKRALKVAARELAAEGPSADP